MSPRAYQLRQVVCEVCGQPCRAQQKDRDICRTCLRNEPSVQCVRCGRMTHRLVQETGVCPSCTRMLNRTVAVCTGCSRTDCIYHQQEQLCKACEDRRRKHLRDKDKQVKVICTVCGQLRSSALLAQAICQACWRQERNGRGICSGCNRLKVFAVKAERLCKHCHQDRLAPKLLRRDAMSFTSP